MKWLALALAVSACTTDTFTDADGSVPDGGSGDGASDVGTGDAAPCTPNTGQCPASSKCNAFDQADSLQPFSDFSLNGGAQAFETDQFMTCPRGVAASIPQANAGSPIRGAIGMTSQLLAPSLTAHARIELDILLPAAPAGSSFFLYLYAAADFAHGIGFEWQNGFWILKNHVTNDQVTLQPPPRTGAWNHVALDVDFSTDGNVGTSEVDYFDESGTKQTRPLQKETLTGGTTTFDSVTFVAGVGAMGVTTAPMTVYLDDVVFTP